MYSGEDLHFTLYAPRGNTVIMALILSQNKTRREKEPEIVFVSVRGLYISRKNDFDTTLPLNASLQSNGQLHDHYPIIFCTCCSARLFQALYCVETCRNTIQSMEQIRESFSPGLLSEKTSSAP